MKTAAIVAEYNPFHNGHAFHIEQTRRLTGADAIIAVMSGDFVQRGAPALFDKYVRTRMALLGGADLVIELPAVYALSSAKGFANGAVSLIDALSCVDVLSFGSECGSVSLLSEAASLLLYEEEGYLKELKAQLKRGLSFPAARSLALKAFFPEQECVHDLLDSPNNILAVEYCMALKRLNSQILPFTVKREGAGYHDTEPADPNGLNSASAIRSLLAGGANCLPALEASVPEAVYPVLNEAHASGSLVTDDFSSYLSYRLCFLKEGDLARYPDVSEDLANRIKKTAVHTASCSEFAAAVKTRQYTRSRIDRILMRLILDLAPDRPEVSAPLPPAPYARILGMKKTAAPLVRQIQENSRIPVIRKPSDAQKLLSGSALACLQADIRCSELYRITLEAKTGGIRKNEYTRGLILL